MRVVAALGGNALLRRGEPMTVAAQLANVRRAARALAALVTAGHQLIITHGNGPQIGLLAARSAEGPASEAMPLDVLGASTDGMLGYLIEQALANELPRGVAIATLLTRIRVNAADAAFRQPTKPIGSGGTETEIRALALRHGWSVAQDGAQWRRVVASPRPLEVLALPAIRLLVEQGVVVICGGGGGIPVVQRGDGRLAGVEAVIDKDLVSSLLAEQLQADALLLLTDVDAVSLDFGLPTAQRIARVGVQALAALDFAAGSMAPKVAAAMEFVHAGGPVAAIGRLEDAGALLAGMAGTQVQAVGGLVTYPQVA
jgi:carbamate kinase